MRAVLFFLFFLSACQIPSRAAMDGAGGRTAYNMAIQMTNSQQMLLNLVRLRYVDIPLFLDVGGITTQFTYKTRVSPTLPIPGFNDANPFVLGGELSWQDQPTISYFPLEGKAFSSRLLYPIKLSTIQQLVYSGWEINRVFHIILQNFEDLYNAPEASGPFPEKISRFHSFSEAVDLFRYFQARGELQIGVKVEQKADPNSERGLQLVIPDEGPQAHRILELLPRAQRRNGKIFIDMAFGFDEMGRVGLMPRTILSCMYYLSQGVSVPGSHLECGLVKKAEEEPEHMGEVFSHLFRVHSSFLPPKSAYAAVQYRNHWFYIDDCDLVSKKTFVLLLQLYNLHAEEAKTIGPILTLPLK